MADFLCPKCQESFTTRGGNIYRHMSKAHGIEKPQAMELLGTVPKKKPSELECPVCHKMITTKRGAIIKHLKQTHTMKDADAYRVLGWDKPKITHDPVDCPLCSQKPLGDRALLIHMRNAHGQSGEDAWRTLGLMCKRCDAKRKRKDSDYCSDACEKGQDCTYRTCPVCEKQVPDVRGSIYKHMRVHGFTRKEAAIKLGELCDNCGEEPRRSDNQFCSAKCGRVSAGEKISAQRKAEDDGQKSIRLENYYSKLESERDWAVSPEAVTNYVESLGFILREPHQGSSVKLQLTCSEGHKFERLYQSFRESPTCTICADLKRRYTIDRLTEQLSKYSYIIKEPPESDTLGFVHKDAHLVVTCDKGHNYNTKCLYVLGVTKQRCPLCNRSKEESEIADILAADFDIICNDRTLIHPYELDIVIPEHKLAIEYCGLYWHSEAVRPEKEYHKSKMQACNEAGYRLITIFADEWAEKPEVCLSRIRNACGQSQRIGARKLTLRETPLAEAQQFFDAYHLQGRSSGPKAAWGLYMDGELLACMSLGRLTRAHVGSDKTLELKRMATKPGYNIPGGFQRMLKAGKIWAKGNGYESIRSYCDLRWGTGTVYGKAGFALTTKGKPSYSYTNGTERFSAFGKRKTVEERDTGLTEWELRARQGLFRIWDCGHQTWNLEV